MFLYNYVPLTHQIVVLKFQYVAVYVCWVSLGILLSTELAYLQQH
jgi:hypothetical protein